MARLRTADEKELIDFALESAVALTGSEVGYLHFVDDDQQNLTLYTWSERTLQNCSVGTERHYPLSLAGIWADCVRLRRPVIHNDYATAEGKKGLPEGHFPLVRHLSTCVVERDKVTVVAGVGNKPTPYQDDDVRQLQLFLDGVWDLIALQRQARANVGLQDQLRATQKLEAIGRLSGGIAHDFNNLLTVILSYSNLALEALNVNDPLRADVEEIRAAGTRAAALTAQLLAFGRRQLLRPEIVDVNTVVAGVSNMLGRLLGEDIEMETRLAPGLETIEIDPGQLEQVVMNIAVNARDAMPDGGKLTIETANVMLDAEYAAAHASVTPGPHVRIAFTDNGMGMDAETRSHLFEPFYTTKPPGKGTGLGLSTVFGIVKQSGGHIWVYSEPGSGTSFKLHFPVSGRAVSIKPPVVQTAARRGTETVLVVEDEPAVRKLAARIISGAGYRVLQAANGGEALLLCEQHVGDIHLLVTDVVMPGMSGRQLADRLATLRPELRALYMSGYTENAVVHHGVLEAGIQFIGKPLQKSELLDKIRSLLDSA